MAAIDPPAAVHQGYQQQTPEERAASERKAAIDKWARRLAIGPFAGTPLEGRAFWPDPYEDNQRKTTLDGIPGFTVTVKIFVSDDAIAAQADAAVARYEEAEADRAAAIAAREIEKQEADAATAARSEQLIAMTPPAIALIDGDVWERAEDGSYSVTDDGADGYVHDWIELLANFKVDQIEKTFETRAEFEAVPVAEVDGE